MSVLRTKLFIPQLTENLIVRPDLHQRLDQKKRLTLISASAGFGKTTLITAWLKEQTDSLKVWLALDGVDNDLLRFFTHLLAGFQAQHTRVGATILPNMLGILSATNIWTILINDMIDIGRPMILVFDDYHLIENRELHEGVAFLVEHAPPSLNIIMTTRVDPPLALARLRAKGQLTELRSTDLRFTLDETQELFNHKLDLKLDPADLKQLQTRTEGWIASLQLAGIALDRLGTEQSQQELIQNFSGSDRYVMDYLLSDVLSQLSAEDQAFLTQTAHLDRFTAQLCDAVRRAKDSQQILDRLEKANLFLFPLDNRREWYRYHHLFADLLRVHGEQSQEQLRKLHQQASDWFESEGLIEEAVGHAFSAEAEEKAADLIAKHAHPLFSQGKILLIYSWLDRLPTNLIIGIPALYLVYGLSLFRIGRFDALSELIKQRPKGMTIHQQGEYISLQAYAAFLDGNFGRALELAEQALTKLDPENFGVQMPVITLKGWCFEMQNRIPEAIQAHIQTLPMAYKINSFTGTVASLGKLILLHAQSGENQKGIAYYQELMEFYKLGGQVEIALAGMAHIGHGLIQQDEAEIRRGIELCREWGGLHIEMIRGYKCLLDLKQNQTAVVREIKQEVEEVLASTHLPSWVRQIVCPTENQPLLDPLTSREKEILGWLSHDLSVPQIAQKLVIGESTVRSHIKKVYAKLDVHSRHEAVQVAKQL